MQPGTDTLAARLGALRDSLEALLAANATNEAAAPLHRALGALDGPAGPATRAALACCHEALCEFGRRPAPPVSGAVPRETWRALSACWALLPDAVGGSGDDYLRDALREAFDWYRQADSKAQTILGFTGVFLSIVVGSVVLKREPAVLAAHVPPGAAAAALAAVLLLYLAGVGLSVAALWSRGVGETRARDLYFFAHIANYGTAGEYLEAARANLADPGAARLGRAEEILALARNTRRKHRLVNFAVLSSGSALLATVILGLAAFLS